MNMLYSNRHLYGSSSIVKRPNQQIGMTNQTRTSNLSTIKNTRNPNQPTVNVNKFSHLPSNSNSYERNYTNSNNYSNAYSYSNNNYLNSNSNNNNSLSNSINSNMTNSTSTQNTLSNNNKYMMSNSKDNDKYQKDKYNQFRINEPKKSETILKSNLQIQKDQQQKKYYEKNIKQSKNRQQTIVKQNKAVGLVGLNNIGNTCFMNSTLQCLFNLPEFNDYFLQDRYLKQINSNSCRVAQSYAKLIKGIRNGNYRAQTPSELKNSVSSKKPRFQGYAQQDAQQFLTGILELLSQQLNRSPKPRYKQLTADISKYSLKQISQEWWKYNKQRQDSIITDFFTGQILSRVVCSKCSNQSIAFDNTWDFALNFNKYDDGQILTMVQNFLKQEIISNDYYCSKCKNQYKAFRQCKRKLDFFRLPKIIVFQLKRFSYGKYKKLKLNNRVKMRQNLDLSSLISMSEHQSVKNPLYELVGIVNHSGDIDYGHYTAQCRNPANKKWYTFNDSSVYQSSSKQNYQSPNPYLLFYAKKDIV